jgi:hypothetical protein
MSKQQFWDEINKTKKPRAKRKSPESDMQTACVKWFVGVYPQHKGLLYAIPNGGSRHKLEAARLKREGVVAGIPDLFLSIPRKGFHGFYLEAKIKGNTTSKEQKIMIEKLKEQGYKAIVFWSLDEFMKVVTEYLK